VFIGGCEIISGEAAMRRHLQAREADQLCKKPSTQTQHCSRDQLCTLSSQTLSMYVLHQTIIQALANSGLLIRGMNAHNLRLSLSREMESGDSIELGTSPCQR